MATATNAAVGDMILVGGPPTNSSQHAPGLYYVVSVSGSGSAATYAVTVVGQDNPTGTTSTQVVPQSRVVSVYKQD